MVASVAEGRAVPPDLANMAALMDVLDHPERCAPVIHVTGTNGKTSTVRAIASLLAAKGLRVGTYTSPHLELINERIAADGVPISDADLQEMLGSLAGYAALVPGPLRWFELVTAAAFVWFADRPVDVMVLEVGMGGRWDATNVASAAVAVITNVGLDHIEFLGPTRQDIAREKAGIIKPASILVLGESDPALLPVFMAETSGGAGSGGRSAGSGGSAEAGDSAGAGGVWLEGRDYAVTRNEVAVGGRSLDLRTPGAEYEGLWLDLHGSHQGRNFAAALAGAEAFFGAPVDDKLVREAAATVSSPGRMEIVSREPLVVLDGAKNLEGAAAASLAVAEEFGGTRSVVLVVGMLGGAGKDPLAMLTALGVGTPAVRLVVACPAPSPRSVPEDLIADAARRLDCGAIEAPGVAEALEAALADAGETDLILVTGSLYVVGAARSALVALA